MVPDPEVKIALRSMVPVSSWRAGVPVTTTSSSKVTVRLMTSPVTQMPSGVVESTRVMVVEIVGLTVLMERVSVLLVLSPSLLVFPAELEKVPEATEMTASEVLLASAVKVAV